MANVLGHGEADFLSPGQTVGFPKSFEDMMNFQHPMLSNLLLPKFMHGASRRRRIIPRQTNFAERTSSPASETRTERQRTEEFVKVLNIPAFLPSNVELVVDTDGKLIITGRQEITKQNETYSSSDTKEFTQTVQLPENINEEEITLETDARGHLVIRAPFLTSEVNSNPEITSNHRHNELRGQNNYPNAPSLDTFEDKSDLPTECTTTTDRTSHNETLRSNEQFVKTLNLKGFEPENIELVVNSKGKVMVCARKECMQQSGGYKSSDVREYKQYVDLPHDVVKEHVTSSLDENGVLTIRAPYTSYNKWLTEEPCQPKEKTEQRFVSRIDLPNGAKEDRVDGSISKEQCDQPIVPLCTNLDESLTIEPSQTDSNQTTDSSFLNDDGLNDDDLKKETPEVEKPKKTKKVKMVRKVRKLKRPEPENEVAIS